MKNSRMNQEEFGKYGSAGLWDCATEGLKGEARMLNTVQQGNSGLESRPSDFVMYNWELILTDVA